MNIPGIRFIFASLTAAVLGLCGALTEGQAVPPPPPPPPTATARSGPTMEETVQFMKKVLAGLSPISYSYTVNYDTPNDDGTWKPAFMQIQGTAKPYPSNFSWSPNKSCELGFTDFSERIHGVAIHDLVMHLDQIQPDKVALILNSDEQKKESTWEDTTWIHPVHKLRNQVSVDYSPEFYWVSNDGGNFAFGPFEDKTLAERFARALIHATTLCHKDEGPSPF